MSMVLMCKSHKAIEHFFGRYERRVARYYMKRRRGLAKFDK